MFLFFFIDEVIDNSDLVSEDGDEDDQDDENDNVLIKIINNDIDIVDDDD